VVQPKEFCSDGIRKHVNNWLLLRKTRCTQLLRDYRI